MPNIIQIVKNYYTLDKQCNLQFHTMIRNKNDAAIRCMYTCTHSDVIFTSTQCNTANDAVTSASPLLSAVVTQAQGINPIFSALGYTFMRIVVDQVTALDSVMYDVMFIAAFSGSEQ